MAPLFLAAIAVSCATAREWRAANNTPVVFQHIVRTKPNLSIFVVQIDLADPRVSVRVARGGEDPDGNGPWLTTLLPTSEIAEREHFDIAVNADFFDAKATVDVEGKNTGYIRGKAAAPVGTAMTDGKLWHRPAKPRPFLEITSSGRARIGEDRPNRPLDPAARQIAGGGQIIVRDGRAVAFTNRFALVRNPRTVAGVDRTGSRLTLMVVDGRQPKLSVGMFLIELSREMIRLGCYRAINLDGGGSSTLVYRQPGTGKLGVLNSPSDTKERAVADVLGVTVRAPLPEPK